jgi:hypothetical protein
MKRLGNSLLLIWVLFLVTACTTPALQAPLLQRGQPQLADAMVSAVQPRSIAVAGVLATPNAEISGLDWYGDWLVLLPQYPHWFGNDDGALFILHKQEILDFLDGHSSVPLTPRLLPFRAPGIRESIPGFEGYEAIAFLGDQVFMTVEARVRGSSMQGWLFTGRIAPDLSGIHLQAESRVALPPQAPILNMSDETVLVVDEGGEPVIVTLYEINGHILNVDPVARRFRADLSPLEPIPFPNVEYRITDATRVDEEGRFWVINYLWPGEWQLLFSRYWLGDSPPRLKDLLADTSMEPVERLIEFQYTPQGITFTDSAPINLELLGDGSARNWEGIVRLDNRGFVLATDKFPETILAFVPLPE